MSDIKRHEIITPTGFPTEKTSKNHTHGDYDAGSNGESSALPSLSPCSETSAEPDCQLLTITSTPNGMSDEMLLTNCKDIVAQTISITQIILDPALQSRVKTNDSTIETYEELMRTGHNLPAVDLFNIDGQLVCVDGFHRINAARRANRSEIECTVHYGTRKDALIFAAGVNAEHGLPRTNADKRFVVNRVLNNPELNQRSNVQISEICRVSESFVRTLRTERSEAPAQSRTYMTKQGKTATMNVEHIGKQTSKNQQSVSPHEDTPSEQPVVLNLVHMPESTKPVDVSADIANATTTPDNLPPLPSDAPMSQRPMRDELLLSLSQPPKKPASAELIGTSAFIKASEYDPVTGGRLNGGLSIKDVPIKLTKDQAEQKIRDVIHGYLTPKDQSAWEEIRNTGQLGETDLDILQSLISEVAERIGDTS